MDFFDALKRLRDANPDCNESELRSALDSEVNEVEENLHGRNKYARAVETAYGRIVAWLKEGDEYAVVENYGDFARFASSHRPACVFAVMVAKSRVETAKKTVTVKLLLDQWPVILKSMEIAAEGYHKECREVAEACILETRIEVRSQIDAQEKTA